MKNYLLGQRYWSLRFGAVVDIVHKFVVVEAVAAHMLAALAAQRSTAEIAMCRSGAGCSFVLAVMFACVLGYKWPAAV